MKAKTEQRGSGRLAGFFRTLGPGLITGASDDDPSGIGTYSQAGAQFGFGMGWTMLLTFPLMAAIQEISARIGRTTGQGIAGNLRRHYTKGLLYPVAILLFVANAINIGADLNAMGDALKLLAGGPSTLYAIVFGAVSVIAIVFMRYEHYVRGLKWLTLVLFAYVATLFATKIPWGPALRGLFIPTIGWNGTFFTTLVAIFGTTISPYLFFWQASLEAEDERVDKHAKPLLRAPWQAGMEFSRIRADTLTGMAFSNAIALSIIFTCAAALHAKGVASVESSAQAAEALRPIAGDFAFILFAIGIIGTGLLAIPVLAGSAAYAVGESFHWRVGLARKPTEATSFYGVLAAATLLGSGITLTPLNPIQALYWSAVINGVVAVPVMIVMMFIASSPKVMGKLTVGGWLNLLGWAATGAMALCVAAMASLWLLS
jgi:NRAMP (natural resistance-associated macrophage protein)-like metal ion transporter